MSRPLLLVDAASLYFRAFHGIPASITAPDGTPVNAVRGFLDMLAQLIRARRPDRMVCCLDADWRPDWRVALIGSYKAHRVAADGGEAVPEALSPQVPIILDALRAVGIGTLGAPGCEADDIIGALAAREPGPVEVATGDRDLFQVIDDDRQVRVLYCGRGVAKLEVYDDTTLHARYGVHARQYVDFAVLRGDPSDGLPGVAGIGDKTAAGLLGRYQTLDALLAAVDAADPAVRPAQGRKLAAARDYLAVAPRVVTAGAEAPVPAVDTALPAAPVDEQQLLALAERWNLASPLTRLTDALAETAG
ncbi:5'-3' exonuclease [Actinocatenispora thailandica]|uniref:5'-3' exonuclease n=1 Tax=Actinocatenispora thailandica TaxID=227318 RepID=A0A7R7DPA5_9ACTN|nr:5'-3' exonuclease [Actinocatenispora thailandica]BCJ35425.1 5'-3' exonuclease [Actinocatenispora thailandica]